MKFRIKINGRDKAKLTKIILLLITTTIAILIVSATVGREIYEGKTETMLSFGLVHFAGYLFFLLMPVEMAFVYYLSFYEKYKLIGIAVGTAFVAQLIDYIIGFSLSLKIINNLVGERRVLKAEKYIQKYGNITIFMFNLFPLSSPIIALAAGILKYPLKYVLFYSLVGLLLKYIILALIF